MTFWNQNKMLGTVKHEHAQFQSLRCIPPRRFCECMEEQAIQVTVKLPAEQRHEAGLLRGVNEPNNAVSRTRRVYMCLSRFELAARWRPHSILSPHVVWYGCRHH